MSLRTFVLVLALSVGLRAQDSSPDKITLNSGDMLQGTIKTMSGGELVLSSPALGDLKIKIADIKDLVSARPIVLVTKNGDRVERRISGVKDGALQLGDGPAGALPVATLPLDQVDKMNPPPDVTAWSGSFTLGAALFTGNTERRNANADATAERRTAQDRLTGNFAWEYSEDKTTIAGVRDWRLTQRRTYGQLKYDWFFDKKNYLWVNTSAENNEQADLVLRYTIGAGLGHQWFEHATGKFSTEVGLAFFSEDLEGAAETDQYLAARAAYKYERKLSDTVKFVQTLEAFPSLERAEDIYLKLDSRLIANLSASMIAQLKIVLDYDNTPAAGRERLDVAYFLSIGWTF